MATDSTATELAGTSSQAPKPGPVEVLELIQLPSAPFRERALPIRSGDLKRLLLAQPELSLDEREKISQFDDLLGATFHSEFFSKLRELKDLYAPLDPDCDYVNIADCSRVRTDTSDEDFLPPLEATLNQANYKPLGLQVIQEAVAAPNETGLTYVPDFSLFEHLRVYVRGYTQITRTIRTARTGFRKRTVVLDAYQRMVLLLKFKEGLALGPFVRSDVIYLRMFKDVPHVDMEMHLPEQGTRVKMRWIDKAQIASPIAVGLPTLAMKALGAAAAFATMNPVLLAPLVIAPITAGVNSFFGFQRAKQKHLSTMIRNLYYLTLANNVSVLNRLVDSAEEEEYKEAMLGYFLLWIANRAGEEPTESQLDTAIEAFLRAKTGLDINFEVSDALAKLFRLGLAQADADGKLRATPLEPALAQLDSLWDNTFRYPGPALEEKRENPR